MAAIQQNRAFKKFLKDKKAGPIEVARKLVSKNFPAKPIKLVNVDEAVKRFKRTQNDKGVVAIKNNDTKLVPPFMIQTALGESTRVKRIRNKLQSNVKNQIDQIANQGVGGADLTPTPSTTV